MHKNDDDLQYLITQEAALLTHEVRSNASILNRLIADDFIEYGASGAVFGKLEVLERLPTEEGPRIHGQDFVGRRLGSDVVQIVFRTIISDAGSSQYAVRSSIWRFQDDAWQMVFHQGTTVSAFDHG